MATQDSRQAKTKSKTMKKPKNGFAMPPEPQSISSDPGINPATTVKIPHLSNAAASVQPTMPISPRMVNAIKNSRKGQIPKGLAKWMANHKKGGQ